MDYKTSRGTDYIWHLPSMVGWTKEEANEQIIISSIVSY